MTPVIEKTVEIRESGEPVPHDIVVRQVDDGLVFYPDGPGKVKTSQGLTIPGPPRSYASAVVRVSVSLPCEANEESVLRTGATTKLLTEQLLEPLRDEAAEYLLKMYGLRGGRN